MQRLELVGRIAGFLQDPAMLDVVHGIVDKTWESNAKLRDLMTTFGIDVEDADKLEDVRVRREFVDRTIRYMRDEDDELLFEVAYRKCFSGNSEADEIATCEKLNGAVIISDGKEFTISRWIDSLLKSETFIGRAAGHYDSPLLGGDTDFISYYFKLPFVEFDKLNRGWHVIEEDEGVRIAFIDFDVVNNDGQPLIAAAANGLAMHIDELEQMAGALNFTFLCDFTP